MQNGLLLNLCFLVLNEAKFFSSACLPALFGNADVGCSSCQLRYFPRGCLQVEPVATRSWLKTSELQNRAFVLHADARTGSGGWRLGSEQPAPRSHRGVPCEIWTGPRRPHDSKPHTCPPGCVLRTRHGFFSESFETQLFQLFWAS